MKKIASRLIIALFACLYSLCVEAEVKLPVVNIAGEDYYVYESRKGDSLYGISNRYGWNVDRLMAINPSLTHKLNKGSKVYYPLDSKSQKAAPEQYMAETYPVIQHIVKKGDSVYSLSKMYGVSIDQIYLYNPDSKYGLKRGSVITIPQESKAINDGSRFFYYVIRPGDTLSSVANTYNTSVNQLLSDNKGISDENFAAGDLLRISVNSKRNEIVTETVDETVLDHVDSYKVGKDDTWESIAQKTGSDAEQLKTINNDVDFKKNAVIDIPVVVTSSKQMEVEPIDERENTAEGVHDIYNEVHKISTTPEDADAVRLALIIEDPLSKRDNEFARGALIAIEELKASPYKISFKLLQDKKSAADSIAVVKALLDSLDSFNPDVVIATHERNFPAWLAEYGEDNGVEIVNSFDVKNEFYLQNPSMIHLLTPSSYFSEAVADWEKSTFSDYQLMFAGKKDADDAYADAIIEKNGTKGKAVDIEVIAEMKLDDWGHYLIYGYPSTRDEVSALLNAVVAMKEANPLTSVKVMGRPNWITFADDLKEQFAKSDVYFPSRFYFDHSGDNGRKFIADYSASFGHGPIRAFPTYAASGFDITKYFIESLALNDGDFNRPLPEGSELQTPINLQRVGNWGGFFNPSAYIIRYNTLGEVEKILLAK